DAVVADAAEDEPARERLALVRRHCALVRVELVADEFDSLDPFLTEDLDRRVEEAEDDTARLALRLSRGEVLQHGEVAFGVRAVRLGALEVGGPDPNHGAGGPPPPPQPRGGGCGPV